MYDSIEWLDSLGSRGMRLGLDRISSLLSALGDPQTDFGGIHIAGSKGKGTVAHLASGILSSAGLKTGRYTSPHILDIGERITIDDRKITLGELDRALSEVRAAAERGGTEITYFEALTAAAFLYFSDSGVDTAVIETGLGGRLDATRCFNPGVAVITSIELEHTAVLGNTLRAIAGEKAHIIPAGGKAVSGLLHPEAMEVVESHAIREKASLHRAGSDFSVSGVTLSKEGTSFSLEPAMDDVPEGEYTLPLVGAHYAENAALAVVSSSLIANVDHSTAQKGIARGVTSMIGRQQRLSVGGRSFLLDIAHTPASASALVSALPYLFHPDTIVIGVFRDKNIAGILDALSGVDSRIIATTTGRVRSLPQGELASQAERVLGRKVDTAPTVMDAITMSEGDTLLFGSATVVEDALRSLGYGDV